MKIDLKNGEFVVTADRRYVAQLRALPDRRWDSFTQRWHATYTCENYDQMVANGWPVEHIPRPDRSALFIDLVNVKGQSGQFFSVFTPARAELIAICRGIPEHRVWSNLERCWLARATTKNAAYLQDNLDAQWSPEATAGALSLLNSALTTEQASVDVSDFRFKTAPWKHQARAFGLSRSAEVFSLLMEQRTGKTKVIIDTSAWLRMKGEIEAVFIICPNTVKDVWVEELAAHMPEWVDYTVVVDGSGKASRDAVDKLNSDPKTHLKVLITNAEALVSKEREKVYARFLSRHRALVAVDEFTRFKNPMAKRSRALMRLRPYCLYRRILSGTPTTQSPIDVYLPYRWLDEAILGFRTWTQCRAHHAIMGGFQAKQIVGYVKVEEIAEKIAPYSFRVLAKDCFDLPPMVYQKRIVELSAEQRRIYDELRDDLVAELSGGQKITSPHALVRLMRLSQITGGFVVPDFPFVSLSSDLDEWDRATTALIDDHMKPQRIDGPNPKLIELLAIVADLAETYKVVIWARFRAEIALIMETLHKEYGETSAVQLHGGISTDERTEARARFQGNDSRAHDPACRFFVGQVDTGGVGIKLARAHTSIYYSNGFSLESRLQSESRIIDEQQLSRNIIDIVAKNTLDAQVLGSLRAKKKFANSVTGDLWQTWL